MTPEELFAEHKARLEAGQPAPLKLALLEPGFFRYETRIEEYHTDKGKVTGPREYRIPVATLAEAQCIFFLCPICVHKQGHQVEVTFAGRGVLDHQGNHNKAGNPTRWNVSGNDFSDLTTTPSILLEGGCAWHGFITNGEIR